MGKYVLNILKAEKKKYMEFTFMDNETNDTGSKYSWYEDVN